MLRSRHLALASLLLVAAVACSDDDDSPTGPTPLETLVGSYTTQSFVYTSIANPELSVDLATVGAGITSLTVNADATFSGNATLEIEGSLQSIVATGTLTDVNENNLTINFDPPASLVLPNPLPVAYELVGNSLTFTANNINFDFSVVPGLPEGEQPSILEVVLSKVS